MRALRFAAALLVTPLVLAPFTQAKAQMSIGVGLAITVAPPMLPVYEQPPMPEPGYIWTPGYWAYGDGDYYWVPGTWVQPPAFGMYWTPGYWAWSDGVYLFNAGYWGPEVGYYGGIDYGYGYGGVGYLGGEWHGRDFSYNRSVNNFGHLHIDNSYDRPIEHPQGGGERPSFNGPRGVSAHPTPQEEAAGRLGHLQPTEQQLQHVQAAGQDRNLRASVNSGHPAPAVAATSHPRGVTGAAAPVHQPAPAGRPSIPVHEATPMRPAIEPHQAAPQHEAAPQRQAAPQHEVAPERQAPPQHEPAPQRQAAPQHEAAPQHQAAPHEEEHR